MLSDERHFGSYEEGYWFEIDKVVS